MIIRAYELEKGDLFLKQGITYIVIRKSSNTLWFNAFSREYYCANGSVRTMSANSQERVEYVEAESVEGYVLDQIKKKVTKKKGTFYKPINKQIRKADILRLNTSSHF